MICRLLMTGNELMTGVTVDTNFSHIAARLANLDIAVSKKVTVGDNLAVLEQEINDACEKADLLIINGGLGPTEDDLTAIAVANAASCELAKSELAEQHIRSWCEQRGLKVNDANLKQAWLPVGAELIPNPVGSAVGIQMEIRDCLVLCTPGVPSEMRKMLDEQLLPLISQQFPDCGHQYIKRLQVFGIGESSIQQLIHNQCPDWPENVELGFRAGAPTLELKLTVRSEGDIPDRDKCETQLKSLLGEHIFAEGGNTLASTLVQLLAANGKTLTTAESCTGGLIASMITEVSGASAVFHAGYVTYSNEMKQAMLGVCTNTLEQQGAVSEETVQEMANGALLKSGSDYVIAVSGIAGPEGGSAEKPVGTVWIAWGSSKLIKTQRLIYPLDRKLFQTMIAAFGLDLIRRELLGISESPRYFKLARK